MGATARARAARSVPHPPDCAACAANRAALLRNALPTRVCDAETRQPPLARRQRAPLAPIACPQRSAPRAGAPARTIRKPASPSRSLHGAHVAPYQAGLKAFTALVASKLVRFRSIQHTTLADMLVSEALESYQNKACYDSMTIDKNIRRRTYDTLNVFASMGIVLRSGKNVMWKGHQAILEQLEACTCKRERNALQPQHSQHLQTCHITRLKHMKRNVQTRRSGIATKRSFLQTLQRRKQSLSALLSRNLQRDSSRVRAGRYETCSDLTFRVPCHQSCIEMPFIMVACNTSSSAAPQRAASAHCNSCLVELSEDRLSVGLSFNAPFRVVHDYALVDLIMNTTATKNAHSHSEHVHATAPTR